jgi:ATP-dependent Clp protease adapter protein ClpS
MPAVLDRPSTSTVTDITHNTDADELKMWNLLLMKSDKYREDIEEILLKIFPFNKNRLEVIFNDLRAHKVALLWVGTKEVVTEYHDFLTKAELRTTIEPEG